jgi:hypothetical protein
MRAQVYDKGVQYTIGNMALRRHRRADPCEWRIEKRLSPARAKRATGLS